MCPHQDCAHSYGYKHLLQRHLAKAHPSQSGNDSDTGKTNLSGESDEDEVSVNTKGKAKQRMDIDAITGKAYASQALERVSASKALRCPYPHLDAIISRSDSNILESGRSRDCDYVFSRAYDLRRHLRAEHEIEADKDSVEKFIADAKARQAHRRNIK